MLVILEDEEKESVCRVIAKDLMNIKNEVNFDIDAYARQMCANILFTLNLDSAEFYRDN